MSTPYEIPLTPVPQTFAIKLGGTQYSLTVYWNTPAACWMLDIFDSTGTTAVLTGVALVTGVDLLGQFKYLNLGGQLTAQTDGQPLIPPTLGNLGITGRLYFVTTP